MQLPPFRYLGENQRYWDLDSFRVTATSYPPEQCQPRHRHENPTYFFLVHGQFVDDSDELGQQAPGQFELLFHPSGAWHESRASDSGRTGLNLEPSDRWLDKFGLAAKDLGQYRIDDDPVRASDLLRLFVEEFSGPDSEERLLEVILPPAEVVEPNSAWIRRLEATLGDERPNRWSLQSLAAELAVHPVYLARVFRNRYRYSLTTYLLRQRLIRCAKMLANGHSASDVALAYGFADHSHFSRSFRAFYGVAPSRFSRQFGCISSS